MVVPTGTATPWRELTDPSRTPEEEWAVFMRDGHASGSADLLAEALRADGIVRTLGRAIPIAEDARLELAYYGFVDEGDDTLVCDVDGETKSGDVVDQPRPCVLAFVNTHEE